MESLQQQVKTDTKIPSPLVLNSALSFLAGYVDAVGFMALFGLFTAHITGNLVLLSAELATPGHTFPLLKILVFPAFVVGIALAKMLASLCQRKKCNALLVLYIVEMMFLIAFMLVGLIAGPIEDNLSSSAIFAGIMGAMAMGVHSACGRVLLSDLTPTAMMTGNVTQFVIEFIDLLFKGSEKNKRGECAKYFWPIAAFGVGALAAAFTYSWFGFQALLLPIVLILILACIEKWNKLRG